MQSRVLLQEISQILERIDKKINDAQKEPAIKTQVKNPKKIFSSNSSFKSFNDLLGKRSESRSKLVNRKKKSESKPNPENYSYSPLICKKSLKILSESRSSKNIYKHSSSNSTDEKNYFPYTFEPKTNEKSAKILKLAKKTRKVPWDELYKLSYSQKVKKNLVFEDCVDIKEPSEKEFTFKPSNKNYFNIFERQSNWLQEKSEKIMDLAEKNRIKEFKECTFSPKICLKPTEIGIKDLQKINGVTSYLERQKAGKKEIPNKAKSEIRIVQKDLTQEQYNNAISDLKNYLHSFTIF